MRQLTDDELDLVSGGLEGDDITVTGHRLQEIDWWMLGGGGGGFGLGGFGGGGYGGGDGGWGGGGFGEQPLSASNEDFTVADDDRATESAAALRAAQLISGLVATKGSYEFVGLLTHNPNGTFGLANNQLSTNYSPTSSSFDPLLDYSGIYGLSHNHPYDTDPQHSQMNFINQYPSPADWEALDKLVNPPNGAIPANPNAISIFLTDPFGVTREFKYSDKSKYYPLNNSQILTAPLPPSVTGN